MTAADLEALAEYRKHKNCTCAACQQAREVLKRRDKRCHTATAATTDHSVSGAS